MAQVGVMMDKLLIGVLTVGIAWGGMEYRIRSMEDLKPIVVTLEVSDAVTNQRLLSLEKQNERMEQTLTHIQALIELLVEQKRNK